MDTPREREPDRAPYRPPACPKCGRPLNPSAIGPHEKLASLDNATCQNCGRWMTAAVAPLCRGLFWQIDERLFVILIITFGIVVPMGLMMFALGTIR